MHRIYTILAPKLRIRPQTAEQLSRFVVNGATFAMLTGDYSGSIRCRLLKLALRVLILLKLYRSVTVECQ